MDLQDIFEKLKSKFGEKDLEIDTSIKEPYIKVAVDRIVDVCRFLKEDPDLKFDYLMCLSGIDYGKNLGVAYHLWSSEKKHRVVLKIEVSRTLAMVPSICEIHPGANWHEREVYDLFGIKFHNHPDLRRILLADEWEGHPLRKDYKFPKEFQGIPLE